MSKITIGKPTNCTLYDIYGCATKVDGIKEIYQPTEPKSEMPKVKPPKCGSAESSSTVDKASIELLDELYDENVKLRKKLKKARKEKKRWKHKYLELYNYVKMMEDTTYVTTKDPMWERIKLGLGVPPIDQSLYDDDSKSRKFGIRYEY